MKKFNLKNKLTITITIILLGIALTGVLSSHSELYVKDTLEKNTEFLSLVSTIKMLTGGLSGLKIPFIDGYAEELAQGLGETQNYLLTSTKITFIQYLILLVSHSFLFKIGLIGLFLCALLEKRNVIFTKLLIIGMAFNPGLAIYTSVVDAVSKEIHIDYGKQYLASLKAKTLKIKQEHSLLIEEHTKELAEINHENKGLGIFKKLKADVSYDIKSIGNKLHGNSVEIRTLFKTAGHEISAKISNFFSMILFTMLILPIGYAFLIYNLYGSLFKMSKQDLVYALSGNVEEEEKVVNQGKLKVENFFTKIRAQSKRKLKAIGNELETKSKKDV